VVAARDSHQLYQIIRYISRAYEKQQNEQQWRDYGPVRQSVYSFESVVIAKYRDGPVPGEKGYMLSGISVYSEPFDEELVCLLNTYKDRHDQENNRQRIPC
jgi:hypothetical protein